MLFVFPTDIRTWCIFSRVLSPTLKARMKCYRQNWKGTERVFRQNHLKPFLFCRLLPLGLRDNEGLWEKFCLVIYCLVCPVSNNYHNLSANTKIPSGDELNTFRISYIGLDLWIWPRKYLSKQKSIRLHERHFYPRGRGHTTSEPIVRLEKQDTSVCPSGEQKWLYWPWRHVPILN